MTAGLHVAFGLGDHQAGDAYVAGDVLIVAGGDHLAVNVAAHVGDFFGALVDEQHHHVHVGVVGGDAVGHLLQEDGLTRTRRGGDQAALAQPDGRHQVHHAHGKGAVCGLKAYGLLGSDGHQLLERLDLAEPIQGQPVDRGSLAQTP